jgi:hypothetical protein
MVLAYLCIIHILIFCNLLYQRVVSKKIIQAIIHSFGIFENVIVMHTFILFDSASQYLT